MSRALDTARDARWRIAESHEREAAEATDAEARSRDYERARQQQAAAEVEHDGIERGITL